MGVTLRRIQPETREMDGLGLGGPIRLAFRLTHAHRKVGTLTKDQTQLVEIVAALGGFLYPWLLDKAGT